jgi:hypothetical protein
MKQKMTRDPNKREGDVMRIVRFVGVTVAALVIGYVGFLFLYLNIGPIIGG